jgi:PAS domain S-box-containing protein
MSAVFRGWSFPLRVGLVQLALLFDMCASMAQIGFAPNWAFLAVIFVSMATVFFGTRAGLFSLSLLAATMLFAAWGWVTGYFPPHASVLMLRQSIVDYSSSIVWVRVGVVALGMLCGYVFLLRSVLGDLGKALREAESGLHELSREQQYRAQTLVALHESEGRLRAMFEGSRDAIGVGKKGIHVFCNPAYLKLFGFRDNEQIVGSAIIDSIAPSHREEVSKNIRLRSAGKPAPSFYVSRCIKQDGTEFDAEFSVSTYNLNGETYSLAQIRDITEQRLAEETKNSLEEQLRQSHKLEAIGTLASGIAHDFNNILTGIQSYTTLAQEESAENKLASEYLAEVRSATNRAADLVRQILAFSRKSQDKGKSEPVNLELVASEAFGLLRASSPSTIEFEKSFSENVPAVMGEAGKLHQVVMNLGTNAVHAMGDRSGRLRMELGPFDVDSELATALMGLKPGPHVRLAVSDTGRGMDEKTRQRVFEPFFTTKAVGEGTGLGLSVVHGIVSSHGGAIRLTSEVGSGTMFEVFLPALTENSTKAQVKAAAAGSGRGERILFLDDEEIVAKAGAQLLRRAGFIVDSETQVSNALALLQSQAGAFHLVVTDQTMPVMRGLEFASKVHALRPDLPILLVSGNAIPIANEELVEMGVREVIMKPYDREVLVAAVRRHALEKS